MVYHCTIKINRLFKNKIIDIMKKLFLFLLATGLVSLIFAQTHRSTSDLVAENPELLSVSSNGEGVIIGDSPKKLLLESSYTYIGSFSVNDGAYWGSNPPCYTGREAAALIFGGNPEDYVISTNSNSVDPNTITFTSWTCSWGLGEQEHPQDYKVDVLPAGYELPYGSGNAVSAYVDDHTINGRNYVWRVSHPTVPVSNWAIILGVLLIGTFIVIRFIRLG